MPSGPDMGGPGFSSRRPNASSLPTFELPPPPLASSKQYHYAISASQSQTPASLASVGNLLTPPSTVGGNEVSSPSTSSAPAPSYANGGYSSWSPSQSAHPTYYHASQQFHRVPYSPANTVVRGHPHSPPSSDGATMPPYDLPAYATAAPMTPASTLPSMGQQQHQQHQQQQQQQQNQLQNQMMATTPVTNGSANPSPVHSQDAFRPPPTPGYYSGQSTPQTSHFPYSTGPPGQNLSAGAIHSARMSPVTGGPMPSLPAPPVQSPHAYQGRFPYGPVMSNLHNPNGQPMLVGGLPPNMMSGFNSGHAATMQQMYGPPTTPATPQNERPFKCDQCPQSFNRNHDLKRHKRIHLAVKPFPCGHCDKSFSRKDALKRHILVKGCGKAGEVDTPKKEASSTSTSPKDGKGPGSESSDVKTINGQ